MVQLDAAVMRGLDCSFGAVAALERSRYTCRYTCIGTVQVGQGHIACFRDCSGYIMLAIMK